MTNVPARRALLPIVALLAVAACRTGPAGTPNGSPGTSGGPTTTPGTTSTGAIEHPTGPTDVVLRLNEGGGMLPATWLATESPWFSLYGDGTVIFKGPASNPPAENDPIVRATPFSIVKLSEEQIQTLLAFAVGPGGLGVARATYELPLADAPTATFTLTAGSIHKTVSVNGLGLPVPNSPDSPVLAQLASLKQRLLNFAADVGGEQPWQPERYRGVLLDDAFGAPAVAWPWPAIALAEFKNTNPNGFAWRVREMTPAEIGALRIDNAAGGAHGIVLKAPDSTGQPYGFAFRPLLPDESA